MEKFTQFKWRVECTLQALIQSTHLSALNDIIMSMASAGDDIENAVNMDVITSAAYDEKCFLLVRTRQINYANYHQLPMHRA